MAHVSRRWKITASLVSLAIVGSWLHISYNTNLLGEDRLCGGLVPSQAAEAAFSRTGRISDENAPTSGPDDFAVDCWIDNTSALPGFANQQIHVYTTRDRADFPFTRGGPDQATATFFSGEASGAVVDGYEAWVWLPPSCSDRDSIRVKASVTSQASADRGGLAGLAVDTANRLMAHMQCDARPLTAPQTIGQAPEERDADPQRLCGVAGFSLPVESTGQASGIREIAPTSRGPLWSCFVALDDGSDDSDRGSGFATYSVVQDPTVIAGMKKSSKYSEQSPIEGWPVSGFDDNHIVVNCGGKETYFSMEIGSQLTQSWENPDAPRSSTLFQSFVREVGRSINCSKITGPQ